MKNLENFENSIACLRLYGADPTQEKIKPIGTATGFVWKRNNSYFIVTNWHVFTMKDHDTGMCLSSNGSPQYVEICLYQQRPIIESLFLESGERRWLQSSQLKTHRKDTPKSDVAILPLEQSVKEGSLCAFNDLLEHGSGRKDILLEVTMPLSIIGFPLGWDEGLCWVTGKVAKSPAESRSTFLVNAYPYNGMSGAPVLWIFPNRPIKLVKGTLVNSISGTYIQFAGVYSGRMYEKGDNIAIAPLARVWLPSVIDEILSATV